jgi:hypothetical protein
LLCRRLEGGDLPSELLIEVGRVGEVDEAALIVPIPIMKPWPTAING